MEYVEIHYFCEWECKVMQCSPYHYCTVQLQQQLHLETNLQTRLKMKMKLRFIYNDKKLGKFRQQQK